MAETDTTVTPGNGESGPALESGTYEILRQRLTDSAGELRARLEKLNHARQEVFGSIETALVATDRVTTENNCNPRDMAPFGKNRFLFGYNVHIGLRSEMRVEDVFSAYEWRDHAFKPLPLDFLNDRDFQADFHSLFKFYRDTIFVKFGLIGPHLFFVFRVGKSVTDIKTFKWLLEDGAFTYLGNRSDHEFRFPPQHEFEWTRTHRDLHREGRHPHISVEDRVFVETVGGDLTIKVEDNTDSGEGIFSEPVEDKDQTLDDAEIFYASVDRLILLKIRPYQEKDWRYFVFNDKLKEVHRVDAIEQSCVLLPDGQGIIFSRGCYLQNGELKVFDANSTDMMFERRIQAPNREDFLYVFYNRERGDYILMPYNVIKQQVDTPVHCHGFSIFENGELALFKSEQEAQKHHTIQIWQTPFTGPEFQSVEAKTDSFLFKVGNAEIVACMAECHEILALLQRDDSYADRYIDLEKRAGDILDSYFWTGRDEAHNLKQPLTALRATAARAVEEFDKVLEHRRHAESEVKRVGGRAEDLIRDLVIGEFTGIEDYVRALSDLRAVRGELITAKDLRFADVAVVEEIEGKVAEKAAELSGECVRFLLGGEALQTYHERAKELGGRIDAVERVVEGREIDEEITECGGALEMLIETVGNLRVEDATETTRIVEEISSIYASINQIQARLRQRIRELQTREGSAQFAAQLHLISQSVTNFLDRCNTPDRCDDFLGRLMVQVEELENRFADFDDFIIQLAEKRTEITSAFETKKLSLVEARNRRAASLMGVADRMLKGIRHRVENLKNDSEINGFYASDQMVDRLRDVVRQLLELHDPVKAEDIQNRLKTIREDAVRQLRDRQDLFVEGGNVVAFGPHRFNVNTRPVDLTVMRRGDSMALHLSGTRFFEEIEDPEVLELHPVWDMEVVSESSSVYRAEFLAYHLLRDLEGASRLDEAAEWDDARRLETVQAFMEPRYAESYIKGVHDADAAMMLGALIDIHRGIGSLRFHPGARVLAVSAWQRAGEQQTSLRCQLESFGAMRAVFSDGREQTDYIARLETICHEFAEATGLFSPDRAAEAARYLFHVLTRKEEFSFSRHAYELFDAFEKFLRDQHTLEKFEELRSALKDDFVRHFEMLRDWVGGFLARDNAAFAQVYRDETALLLLRGLHNRHQVREVALQVDLNPMLGEHSVIRDGKYHLDYLEFMDRLGEHERNTAPRFLRFKEAKNRLIEDGCRRLRVDEYRPQVLSSFVRNRLVDRTFLPLIGANLAKQMGTAGENTRTDRMGLLLLISPPGYGKTTLMEYIGSRLGLVFMKINGPALGHQVTSLDPADAPNAAAREEVEKLNLSFEMGDNVMIYVDDIQHCHPEFLQKFISLCDGQRRIEGVHRGQGRTYDLRGRRIAVVMAGNPYTESGEKFRIPDMLANRADTYNLGDMATGQHYEAFKLSYLENALTSNPILNTFATRGNADVYGVINMAENGSGDGIELEGNYSAQELDDIVGVMKKLIHIRDVILKVNAEYIRSAGQADAYRTEPPFLLQGSYRTMNRMAEKAVPVMNDRELEELIFDGYRNDAQTLTSGAEANLLKLKELLNKLGPEESERWSAIKKTFQRNLLVRGEDGDDPVTKVVGQMAAFNAGLESIRDGIRDASRTPPPIVINAPGMSGKTPVGTGGSEPVAISQETLRKIWELIEKENGGRTAPTMEIPMPVPKDAPPSAG